MNKFDLRDYWMIVDDNTMEIIELRIDRHMPDYSYIENILDPHVKNLSFVGNIPTIPRNVSLIELADETEYLLFKAKWKNKEVVTISELATRRTFGMVQNGVLNDLNRRSDIVNKHIPQ